MSIISMPVGILIGSFSMEQISYDMVESSDATGAEAIRLFGPPRWRVSLAAPNSLSLAQAADWEVITLTLRRGSNHLAVYDPVRTLPRGTMRGFPTTGAAAPAGSTSIQIASASGSLLKGDWVQIGTGVGTSQLVKVVADVTASGGTATVNFEPSLRFDCAAGTQVNLDHPVFYARSIGKSVKWQYEAGNTLTQGYAFDLLEAFN